MKFVDYESYRAHDSSVDYVMLAPGQNVVPLAPSFLFGYPSPRLLEMMFTPGVTSSVGYYTVRDAVVVRDNIVLRDDTVLTGVSTNHPEHHCRSMLADSEFLMALPERAVRGQVVSLAGPGWATWGHWLVDFLPRLYLFARLGWNPNSLSWLIPADVPSYARDLIKLFGIQDSSLVLHKSEAEILRVEMLIVPQNMTATNVMHPLFTDVATWMARVTEPVTSLVGDLPTKVFIGRRSNPKWRELLNRAEIEGLAGRYGYQVVEPAEMPVARQISLLRNATHVAGEYGSGLHTTIFAPKRCVVTCFRGNGEIGGVLQNGLVKALGQKIGYVVGSSLDQASEPYVINEREAKLGFESAEALAAEGGPCRP